MPFHFEIEIEFSRDDRKTAQFLGGNSGQHAPGMCYIAPHKPRPAGNDIIEAHYKMFAEATTVADQILVMGVALRHESDPHLWHALGV
jgi:hypothetical protein